MSDTFGLKIGLEGEKEFKKALNEINQSFKVLGSEMKLVQSQFSKNDNSAEALAERHKTLTSQIDAQKQKIEMLPKALDNATESFGENDRRAQNWQIQQNNAKATLNDMERELEECSDDADDMGEELEAAGDAAEESEKKFSGLGTVLKSVGAAMGAVVVAAGAATVKLAGTVVQQFGELEQNLGGAVAVYGDYANELMSISEEAYRTMGTSPSEYLATANKMGALFQGSGVSQQCSLQLTTDAMQRAADMASVMGIETEAALEAVAGAAKGNYTMMDNLGVAMNNTTLETYAMANGYDKAWASMSNAEKAEVSMAYFLEQTQQYAGNFEREATETISGSIGLMKASIDSFIAGLGNADADIDGRKIDHTFYPVIYGADEGDDWTDPATWKKVNPSLGITVVIDKVKSFYVHEQSLEALARQSEAEWKLRIEGQLFETGKKVSVIAQISQGNSRFQLMAPSGTVFSEDAALSAAIVEPDDEQMSDICLRYELPGILDYFVFEMSATGVTHPNETAAVVIDFESPFLKAISPSAVVVFQYIEGAPVPIPVTATVSDTKETTKMVIEPETRSFNSRYVVMTTDAPADMLEVGTQVAYMAVNTINNKRVGLSGSGISFTTSGIMWHYISDQRKPAICLQPNKTFQTSNAAVYYTEATTLSGSSTGSVGGNVWNKLSWNQRRLIDLIALYGVQTNWDNSVGNADLNTGYNLQNPTNPNQCLFAAQQIMTWEVVTGNRSATYPYNCTNSKLINAFGGDVPAQYAWLENQIRAHDNRTGPFHRRPYPPVSPRKPL